MRFFQAAAKPAVIALLALALFVPVNMIQGLIAERQQRRDVAVASIAAGWGGRQTLAGPYLAVPYERTRVHIVQETIDGKPRERRTEHTESLLLRIPAEAVLCPRCGYDYRKRKKTARTYEPIARTWEANYTLQSRVISLTLIHGTALVLGVAGTVLAGDGLGGYLVSWFIAGVALAFLMGTFDRIDLTRDTRGRVRVAVTRRVAFFPLPPQVIEVRGFSEVVSGQTASAGFWEWLIFLFLLPGLIPAFVFMNKGSYARLPEAARAPIDKYSGTPFFRRLGQVTDRQNREGHEIARAMPGQTITAIDPAEQQRWRRVVAPVVDGWVAATKDGAKILAAFRADQNVASLFDRALLRRVQENLTRLSCGEEADSDRSTC